MARYAGLTAASDESGQKQRERGLAKAGNARVGRGMIQLAWGHLLHQKDGALAEWYRKRTADSRSGTRKTMIVALARKLLIHFGGWRPPARRRQVYSFGRRRDDLPVGKHD